MQQISADGDGQGFGGFDGFGGGFALKHAGDVFLAIQAGDQLAVQQKQFTVAVDIELVAVGEFDAKIAPDRPG
ncbi:hypothetical protein D3C84_827730 [compost metagenome]